MNQKLWRRIVLVVLALVVVVATLPWLLVTIGNMSYRSHSYGSAYTTWRLAGYVSWYNRDNILFDQGDAKFQAGAYQAAAGRFAAAAAIATPQHLCHIVYNWGLSLSNLGDQQVGLDKKQALSTYSEALRDISVSTCSTQTDINDLRTELLQKIAQLIQPQQSSSQQQNQTNSGNQADQQILNDHAAEQSQQRSYANAQLYVNDPNLNGSNVTQTYNFVW